MYLFVKQSITRPFSVPIILKEQLGQEQRCSCKHRSDASAAACRRIANVCLASHRSMKFSLGQTDLNRFVDQYD